jgi:hypothetical protein
MEEVEIAGHSSGGASQNINVVEERGRDADNTGNHELKFVLLA